MLPLLLVLPLLLLALPAYGQQRPDAPPETLIRQWVAAPAAGTELFRERHDPAPVLRWPAGKPIWVQSTPDSSWYRVLCNGSSFFVRQRDLPPLPPFIDFEIPEAPNR